MRIELRNNSDSTQQFIEKNQAEWQQSIYFFHEYGSKSRQLF